MICMYCGLKIAKFADTRLVNVNGTRNVACADIAECNKRKAAREAARVAGE